MSQLSLFTESLPDPDPNKVEREKLQAIARAAGCRSLPNYPACWPGFIKDPAKQARAYELRDELRSQNRKGRCPPGAVPLFRNARAVPA